MANMEVTEMKSRFRIKHKAPMIEWLRANGFKFRVAADGWPILDNDYVNEMLHGARRARPVPQVHLDHLR